MTNIAVFGCDGYVGHAICKEIESLNKFNLFKLNRKNFIDYQKNKFDIIIHSANPAKRYFANNNPLIDYKESVEKTNFILKNYKYENIITISSLSVLFEPNTFYAKNRAQVEKNTLLNKGKVVRLGPMFGGNPRKSTLQDIIDDKNIFFSNKTKYGYCNVNWVAKNIVNRIDSLEDINNISAKNYITLEEIANSIFSTSNFGNKIDDQYLKNTGTGPDAYDVIEYAKKCKKNNLKCG